VSWLGERFELTAGEPRHRLLAMEGLRGLAVSLVFLVHYASLVEPWISQQPLLIATSRVMHSVGNTGVDLFFVLSGYLIYGSLVGREKPFGSFMMRRIERIYPTFLVVFSLYLVLSFVFPQESKLPDGLGPTLWYLLQNLLLLPGIFPIEPMITVAWSLSYEVFYYLTIPLVISMAGLRHRSAQFRMRFFVAVAAAMVLVFLAFGGPVRLLMFVAGIFLFEVLRAGLGKAGSGTLGFFALIGGLMVMLVPMPFDGALVLRISLLAITFFVVCLVSLGNPGAWFSRALTWRPLRWLGNMSYSYYLLHGLALKAAFLALSMVWPAQGQSTALFWVGLALTFVWTVACSAVLFLVVERPFSLTPKPRKVA
jgi:exopolysaccharide production protein ExoZ